MRKNIGLKKIIIISVDTLRADHPGCYGCPLNSSPNIDAFARDDLNRLKSPGYIYEKE
jgi:hypothetical protein